MARRALLQGVELIAAIQTRHTQHMTCLRCGAMQGRRRRATLSCWTLMLTGRTAQRHCSSGELREVTHDLHGQCVHEEGGGCR